MKCIVMKCTLNHQSVLFLVPQICDRNGNRLLDNLITLPILGSRGQGTKRVRTRELRVKLENRQVEATE